MARPAVAALLALLWACESCSGSPPAASDGSTDGSVSSQDGGSMPTGDGSPADGSGSAPDAGAPSGLPHDVSRIVLVDDETVPAGETNVRLAFYRNEAYRCGRTGYFTFLVVETEAQRGREAPLQVLLHGGSVGYYDASGTYHPESIEDHNDEEPKEALTAHVRRGVTDGERLLDTYISRRARDGYRFLVPAMCDHDLHSGLGQPYPNNPNWLEGDTVDGLLANLAALDFTMRGNDRLPGYETSRVFLWGGSAGSVGAYLLARKLHELGVVVNGAIMDAYVINERLEALGTCSRLHETDPHFDADALAQKISPHVLDPAQTVDQVIRDGFPVPLLDIVATGDPWCCGHREPVAEAIEAGFDNNCAFLHAPVEDAVAAAGPQSLHRVHVIEADLHLVVYDEGPHQDLMESWYQAVLVTDPPPPVWPDG